MANDNPYSNVRPYQFDVSILVQFYLSIALYALIVQIRSSNSDFIRCVSASQAFDRQLQDANNPQQRVQQYKLWEPYEIREILYRWADHYPEIIRVTTAQEAYGLPAAGGEQDCPFDLNTIGCLNYIVTIQDFEAHPEDSISSSRLPEVLWSGELHGNEQVGPTAVLEAAALLLESAACEARPRPSVLTIDNKNTLAHEMEMAKSCRKELYESGIDDIHRKWLARLVTTRRLVIIPTANALGYFQKKREEGSLDANRDFPYDLTNPKLCMNTIAARTINEVYREHLFQLSLTFHGGMEVIGYEWGAPTWDGHFSPDDVGQRSIAAAYSRFAGSFKSTPAYQYGTMNDLVYAVRGGMEDWAYAGSFDSVRVIQCEPETYGGYPKEKTIYSNSTLRAFNMLVEASDAKIPRQEDLGTSLDIMNPNSSGNGHIARNIRLALLALELVEPYVAITKVGDLNLSDDIIPMTSSEGRSCQDIRAVRVPYGIKHANVTWTVGGGNEINEVNIWFAKWDDIPVGKLDCQKQPEIANIKEHMLSSRIDGPIKGAGLFSSPGSWDSFVSSLDLSSFQPGDKIVVIASARVDQSWANTVKNSAPKGMLPQSHVVNARTNADWFHESAGKIVKGRLDWFSIPLTLVLSSSRTEDQYSELSKRFFSFESTNEQSGVTETIETWSKSASTLGWISIILITVSVLFCCCMLGVAYVRNAMRVSHRERVRNFIEDTDAISPGLQQKYQRNNNGFSEDVGLEMPRHTVV